MKKLTALLLVFALALLCLAACGEKKSDAPDDGLPDDLWGISMEAVSADATGMQLVISQSGGEPTGDLRTGATYRLDQKIFDYWLAVDMQLEQDEEPQWPEENYDIPKDGSVTVDIDWEWLYGTLPAGQYRIAKGIFDCRSETEYDAFTFYAEFEITE